MQNKKIIIIDGYSFVFRAYYSMPALSRSSDGTPIGAVYGFTSMMMKLLLDMKPNHIVVVFDSGEKNYRHTIYPNYKANRPPAPEDLIPQFPLVREAVRAFNVVAIEQKGYEADDIIATLAHKAREKEEEVLIVSADKDLMQLVNHHTKMYDAVKAKEIGIPEVHEKYGVKPEQVRDLLALVGDTSDNVPGVPSIGFKTAAELLNTYGTIEGIFANLEQIRQPKRRETLRAHKDTVKLSTQLVSLTHDVPLSVNFDDLKITEIDSKRLLEFLHQQGFKSLIARAQQNFGLKAGQDVHQQNDEPSFDANKSTTIYDVRDLKNVLSKAEQHGRIAFYFQTNFAKHEEVMSADDIHSIGIAINPKCVYYLPLSTDRFCFKDFLEQTTTLLQDTSVLKIFYDYKRFLHLISPSLAHHQPSSRGRVAAVAIQSSQAADRHGLPRVCCADPRNDGAPASDFHGNDDSAVGVKAIDDVMLMSYELGSGRDNTTFTKLIEFYCGEVETVLGGGITKAREKFNTMSDAEKAEYVTHKAYFIYHIHELIQRLLFEYRQQNFYQSIDRQLSDVVYKMEHKGFKVDRSILVKFSNELDDKLDKLSLEIYKHAGTEFNIASPKQLGDILFTRMGIASPEKSNSTSAGVLEELQAQGHTIADLLLEWRKLYKLKTTYTSSLAEQINEKTGRIHSNFSLALTSTGRFSSTAPNLQNIPIKGEWADRIRSAFVTDDGYRILSADYSQIELRLLAEIANVKPLKAAFSSNQDIHTLTASEVFNVPINEITPEVRNRAKAINFGIIYGMSGHSLARHLGISRQEATEYINRYLQKYQGIAEYMDAMKKFASTHGYVQTITGRRCYISGINSKDYTAKGFAERAAINFPLQGSCADVMRKAMVSVDRSLNREDLDCKLILQVHDELIFEVRHDHIEKSKKLIKNVMENVLPLSVPMLVSINDGDSWSSA